MRSTSSRLCLSIDQQAYSINDTRSNNTWQSYYANTAQQPDDDSTDIIRGEYDTEWLTLGALSPAGEEGKVRTRENRWPQSVLHEPPW